VPDFDIRREFFEAGQACFGVDTGHFLDLGSVISQPTARYSASDPKLIPVPSSHAILSGQNVV
jgi:hypothetical protein